MKFLKSLDLQDALIATSVVSVEWGVAEFSTRVAKILFGVICMVAVIMIELSKGKRGNPRT